MDLSRFTAIPEYPEYLVSRTGEVWSTKTNKLLGIFINTSGYRYFSVSVEGKAKNLLLARVLARVFKNLPSLTSELEVDHDDRDILNNDLDNLVVRTKEDHKVKTCKDNGFRSPGQTNCQTCGVPISKTATFCREHYKESLVNGNLISAESIEYWVSNFSWVRAAKELGLSDNGLRKRFKILTGKDPKSIKKTPRRLGV